MNHYIHHVPGRLRIKSPLLKDSQNQDGAKALLDRLPGILSAEFNPTTGSVVVLFDSQRVQANRISGEFQRAGYFDRSKAITNDQYIHRAVTKAGNVVKRACFGSCFDLLFQGSALSYLGILI
jgi:copper chaperone CopZ